MTETIKDVFICPKLVGRQLDLTTLHMLIDRNNGGQGQMILISGEARIGKSRLVAEAKVYAAQRDFLLLEGKCFQTDSAFPYAPLVDLFRSYFAQYSSATLEDNLHSFVSTLSRLLPELALLFPDLSISTATSPVEPEEEKRRLFAAMTHFLAEQAVQHPVLLVVEDVHWCDDLSLEFLLYLTRRCRNVSLLFLVTYRSDELNPRLMQWLANLDRERLAHEFLLERLSHDDVAAMLHAMLISKQQIDDDLVDTLYSRSEGNPFFVEELLKSLMTTRELVPVNGTWQRTGRMITVPRSVQEAVQQRTTYLSLDAKRLLTLAAATGRRFNVILLQEVIQCDEAHLLSLLKEVMSAQLVVEEATDQFAFRHALTQQAILAPLLLRERQGLHRSLAEAIEQICTASPASRENCLEDLAYHYFEADMWEQALIYAQEAAEKALKLYGQKTAIDHFSHAVEAAHHLTKTPSPHLYLPRGQAYETLGDFERARGDYERALDAARTVHNSEMQWQSMESLGFLWTGHDYEQAGIWFHQALSLAEKLSDSSLLARSLNRLGNWLQNIGRIQEAIEAHQEAFRLFEMQVDRQGMAETLEMLGGASFFTGDTARAVKVYFGQAIDLFRSLGDKKNCPLLLLCEPVTELPRRLKPPSVR